MPQRDSALSIGRCGLPIALVLSLGLVESAAAQERGVIRDASVRRISQRRASLSLEKLWNPATEKAVDAGLAPVGPRTPATHWLSAGSIRVLPLDTFLTKS